MPLDSQSVDVPLWMSSTSGDPLSLQSGSHSSGTPFWFASALEPFGAVSQLSGRPLALQSG
jgi:hypothetical protein